MGQSLYFRNKLEFRGEKRREQSREEKRNEPGKQENSSRIARARA